VKLLQAIKYGISTKCCIYIRRLLMLMQEEMVYEWLNPVYLKPDVQEQIREKFEADSEIELRGFLKVVFSVT